MNDHDIHRTSLGYHPVPSSHRVYICSTWGCQSRGLVSHQTWEHVGKVADLSNNNGMEEWVYGGYMVGIKRVYTVPSSKQTWQWEITYVYMKLYSWDNHEKGRILQCYVWLPEGKALLTEIKPTIQKITNKKRQQIWTIINISQDCLI